MYLFDTDVIVELLRGTSDSGLRQKIAKVSASDQYISTISVSPLSVWMVSIYMTFPTPCSGVRVSVPRSRGSRGEASASRASGGP